MKLYWILLRNLGLVIKLWKQGYRPINWKDGSRKVQKILNCNELRLIYSEVDYYDDLNRIRVFRRDDWTRFKDYSFLNTTIDEDVAYNKMKVSCLESWHCSQPSGQLRSVADAVKTAHLTKRHYYAIEKFLPVMYRVEG